MRFRVRGRLATLTFKDTVISCARFSRAVFFLATVLFLGALLVGFLPLRQKPSSLGRSRFQFELYLLFAFCNMLPNLFLDAVELGFYEVIEVVTLEVVDDVAHRHGVYARVIRYYPR